MIAVGKADGRIVVMGDGAKKMGDMLRFDLTVEEAAALVGQLQTVLGAAVASLAAPATAWRPEIAISEEASGLDAAAEAAAVDAEVIRRREEEERKQEERRMRAAARREE